MRQSLSVSALVLLLASACVGRDEPVHGPDDNDDAVDPLADAAADDDKPDADAQVDSDDGSTGEPAAAKPVGTRNFACGPSPSPMYASQSVLKMTISADFTKLNTAPTKEEATSPAQVDTDGDGELTPVAAEVHARGISRFRECGFRPFTITFPKKQKDNVFAHLGKSVKISTHCGDREGMAPILKAPSIAEYEQRVRMEHAVYQVVGALDTLSLKTRLVEMTYHDTAKDTRETYLAFVREPEDETAQRCNMVEGEDIPEDRTFSTNERAKLLLFLVNNFVIQADVKNQFDAVDLDTGLRAPVPYDFDLVGLFRREYAGLDGRSLDDNARAFADWLRRNNGPELQEEAAFMLTKKSAMRSAFESVALSEANLALFNEWFGKYMAVLDAFVACKGAAQDASKPDCHVADDFADTLQDAQVSAPGEYLAMLEPPGDEDVVAVDLPANKLTTLAAFDGLTVLAEDGSVVHALEGYPPLHSIKPTSDTRYYLRLSRGGELVCSDMWNSDPKSDGFAWAVFGDDYGSTLDLATPIAVGDAVKGALELDTTFYLFDEDWFTVDSASIKSLNITFEGTGSARVESFLKAGSVDEIAGSVDLFSSGQPNDLSPLFPEPGEYVVRVIQDISAATYEITAE